MQCRSAATRAARNVGADRVERDVAEVEQAGEADDDVEAEREQHVQQREVGDAHPAATKRRINGERHCDKDEAYQARIAGPQRSAA